MKSIFKSIFSLFISLMVTFHCEAMQICVSTPTVCHTEMIGWTFLENRTVMLNRDVCVPGLSSCTSIPDPITMIRPSDLVQQDIQKNFNWSQYNSFQKEFSQSFTQNYLAKIEEIKKSIQFEKLLSLREINLNFDNQYSSKDVLSKNIHEVISIDDTAKIFNKANHFKNWEDVGSLDNLRNTRAEIFAKEKDFFQPYVESQNEITEQILKQSNHIIDDAPLSDQLNIDQASENVNPESINMSLAFENDLRQSSSDSLFAMEEAGLIKAKPQSKIFLTTNPVNLAKIKYAYQRLDKTFPITKSQDMAKELGLKAVNAADLSFSKNEQTEGDHYYKLAVMLGDVALGLVPIVGPTKDLIEAISGKSLLTGESLPTSARWIAGVGALSLGMFGYFRAGIKLVKTAEALEHSLPSVISKSLNKVVTKSAEEVNQQLLMETIYKLPSYKLGTRVWQFVTHTEIKGEFVRVIVDEGNVARRWILEKKLIQGLTREQIADKFGLKYIPNYIVDVDIPAGVTLRKGIVNPIFASSGERFSIQYEIVEELLPEHIDFENLFKNIRELK